MQFVSDIATVLPLLDMYEDGHAPVAGGVLDQSAWFIAAFRTLRGEMNKIDAGRFEDG